ncbi:MAG TPA: protein-glutamate O-methyltransferase CheR [Nitrospiraceae bacterium]|jgi:chemotaxis protein methyltransferase CheR|nr:protein-glutamate O-methyltransferase CheR [Nitrospiraceae bacterium]
MNDSDCVEFLQWALPRLHLRWPGYRKVRRQVCKRIDRRLKELNLPRAAAYRAYLDDHPPEWSVLDSLCWIPLSRFYRDKRVFQTLEREVLPQLAQDALADGRHELRCWSIGCASGEEPYTLAILWKTALEPRFPALGLQILATDVDPHAIERAKQACYAASSLKELPDDWRARAFVPTPEGFIVKPEYRELVSFELQDIRIAAPDGWFDLILCRYVVFTYFDDTQQQETLAKIEQKLVPGGALVIGSMESLPGGTTSLIPWTKNAGIYRQSQAGPAIHKSR